MRKEMILIIVAFFLASMTAITGVYANQEGDVITITKEEQDITGDGIKEVISLKGVPYKDDDNDLKKIYIEVTALNNKIYRFPLEAGSKASLTLVDLNHDGIKDILASVLTGGSEGNIVNYLYSFKAFSKKKLTTPEPIEANCQYKNGFKAQISIKETGKKYLFNLKDREQYYKKLGLYYRGRLNEPTELSVKPFSLLKPMRYDQNKIGLVGLQRVTGIANSDTIAYIKSTWLLEDGIWKLKNAVVQKEVEKDPR